MKVPLMNRIFETQLLFIFFFFTFARISFNRFTMHLTLVPVLDVTHTYCTKYSEIRGPLLCPQCLETGVFTICSRLTDGLVCAALTQ